MATFQLFFFSVQGTCGSPTGPDSENRVCGQDMKSPGRPVSSGLQVPGVPGHCRARKSLTWRPPRGVFPSKCPSIAPALILRVYGLAFWKIINEEDAVLIQKI